MARYSMQARSVYQIIGGIASFSWQSLNSIVLILTIVLSLNLAEANLIQNGSFEQGAPPSLFTTLGVGNTSIDDWSIVNGNLDYIGGFWAASHGTRSLDMSGTTTGAISQTFATIIGVEYEVRFDLAGNFAAGPAVKGLQASAADTTVSFIFNVTGRSAANMGWEEETFTFTAVEMITSLTFASLTPGGAGPALDNVRVEASEPGTTCGGFPITITGSNEDNIITGTDGPDVIHGLGGNDVIYGLGGNDVICGGDGHDTLLGGDGDDSLFGEGAADILMGEAGNDVLHGGTDSDRLDGSSGDDTLRGGGGPDLLVGGSGDDELMGDDGHDVLVGDSGNDLLQGGPGNDSLDGGRGDDELSGDDDHDVLAGDSGNDLLQGMAGNDSLNGGTGDDVLSGGSGLDVCDGGQHEEGDVVPGSCNLTVGVP